MRFVSRKAVGRTRRDCNEPGRTPGGRRWLQSMRLNCLLCRRHAAYLPAYISLIGLASEGRLPIRRVDTRQGVPSGESWGLSLRAGNSPLPGRLRDPHIKKGPNFSGDPERPFTNLFVAPGRKKCLNLEVLGGPKWRKH